MRIRYLIPFTRKVLIPDHWEIPLQGGICRVRETDGMVDALEVVLSKQPIGLAPKFSNDAADGTPTLMAKDRNLSLIRVQLEDAMAFLWCQFNVGLDWDQVESIYEAESEEERASIDVSNIKIGKHVPILALPFDILGRAIVCAESQGGPNFEAKLVANSRAAMHQERYIDAFRYSFLLFEALYGDGEFKSSKLKQALKKNAELRNAVQGALTGFGISGFQPSDTTRLLEKTRSVDDVIDHLVDKRGHYFHGNVKRKDAWRAERQGEAHALSALSAAIALEVCSGSTGPMYAKQITNKFLEYSRRAGAEIVYQVEFTFRMPGENFSRTHQMDFSSIGTKPTPQLSSGILRKFLERFDDIAPMGALEAVRCTLQGSEETIFELKFATAKVDATPSETGDGSEASSS